MAVIGLEVTRLSHAAYCIVLPNNPTTARGNKRNIALVLKRLYDSRSLFLPIAEVFWSKIPTNKKWIIDVHAMRYIILKKLASSGLKSNAVRLLKILAVDPFQDPPYYEALVGNIKGAISRRVNIQHRLVYQVLPDIHTVKILHMWTHYD